MLFNSIDFLIYFVVVVGTYFLLPFKWRAIWLLVASCFFYMMFKPIYILILAGTIVVDYYAAIWMDKTEGKKRKLWLVLSLVANIGVLVIFKYADFFKLIHNEIVDLFNPDLKFTNFWRILLPMGLSFHTFQAMSYTIEVYRKNQKAEKDFIKYALYVMFFPQLVAGPIERPQNILHQFSEKKYFDYERIKSGLALMAWGMFQKVVIADRLSAFSDQVYNRPLESSGLQFWVGAFFFSFQIYCDFAGYSNIAIGSAKVMGFDLMKNFDRPYSSKTISEFWKRWHISLSTWFRDYLYIPLGGNRVSESRIYFNLFFVFFISGLWHGANWNYLIWGALHGIYLLIGRATKSIRENILLSFRLGSLFTSFIQRLTTFVLVIFAWAFFRGSYLYYSMNIEMGRQMLTLDGFTFEGTLQTFLAKNIYLSQPPREFLISLILICLLETVHYLQKMGSLREKIFALPTLGRWSIYILGLFLILLFGVYDRPVQFIYFQF
ncbi:MAG: MBOAT family O-acyltransferase [Spirosomataceae bacterium]